MSDADSQDNGTERATTITSGLGINMKSAVNASPKSGGFEHPRYPSKDPTGQYANAYNRVASVFYVKPSIPSSSFQGQRNGSPVTSPPSSLENAYGGLELGFEPMGSSSHSGLPTLQATRIPHRSGGPSFPIAHQRPAYSPTYGSPQGPPTIPEYEYNRSLVASTALVPYNPNLSQVMTEESGSDGSAYSDENGENGLFVGDRRYRSPSYSVEKNRGSDSQHSVFSHDDLRNLQPPGNLGTGSKDTYFNNIGRNLEPSRYSGSKMPWLINKDPPLVNQNEVSDAALYKRNLSRSAGHKVCKRGYGANDPENIRIVNLKETEGYSFQEIMDILNQERLEAGKNPSLSICAVAGRYNRTAPLLFQAQGRNFVPLSLRGGRNLPGDGGSSGKPVFNDDLDLQLVDCVKVVDSQKWKTVAQLFTERTGVDMTAEAAAIRHNML